MERLGKVEYIIVHHTGRDIDFPLLVRLRHKYLRGWDDIGYHHLIGNGRLLTVDGRLYPGRSEEFEGAHAVGYNGNSISVCLIGNLDLSVPTEAQLSTLFSLLERKILQYKIPTENVLGHRELPNVTKSCPGRLMNMDYVRSVLRRGCGFSFSGYGSCSNGAETLMVV